MDLRKIADELSAIERRFAPGGDVSPEACARQFAEWRARETEREEVCTTRDATATWLLLRLCGRYGLRPFRRPRQKPTTVCLLAPPSFITEVLWPQHQEETFVISRARAQLVNDVLTTWLGAAALEAPIMIDELLLPPR